MNHDNRQRTFENFSSETNKIQLNIIKQSTKNHSLPQIYLKKTTDESFILDTLSDWIVLKETIKEWIDGNNKENFVSTTDSNETDPTDNTFINTINQQIQKEGLLVFEIEDKKLKIEIDISSNYGTIRHIQDLNLIYWWLDNTEEAVDNKINELKKYYIKEYTPLSKPDWNKKRFIGEKVNGKLSGFGVYYHPNGMMEYIGSQQNNERNGDGIKQSYTGHVCYMGSWVDNKYNGYGIKRLKNGREYMGDFRNGHEDGQGKLFEEFGTIVHEGQWKLGRPHGFGKNYDEIGFITYEGIFRAGVAVYQSYQVQTKMHHSNGEVRYVGGVDSINSTYNGLGSLYSKKGQQLYYGGYKKGLKHGIGKEYNYSCWSSFKSKFDCAKACSSFIKRKLLCCCSQKKLVIITPMLDLTKKLPITKSDPSGRKKSVMIQPMVQQPEIMNSAKDNRPLLLNISEIDKSRASDIRVSDSDRFNHEHLIANQEILSERLRLVTKILEDMDTVSKDNVKQISKKNYNNQYFGFYKNNRKRGRLKMMDIADLTIPYFKKDYHKSGQMSYNGYYLKNKKEGRGKLYYDNTRNVCMYAGEIKNDLVHGYGMIYSDKGKLLLEGNFKNGKLLSGVVDTNLYKVERLPYEIAKDSPRGDLVDKGGQSFKRNPYKGCSSVFEINRENSLDLEENIFVVSGGGMSDRPDDTKYIKNSGLTRLCPENNDLDEIEESDGKSKKTSQKKPERKNKKDNHETHLVTLDRSSDDNDKTDKQCNSVPQLSLDSNDKKVDVIDLHDDNQIQDSGYSLINLRNRDIATVKTIHLKKTVKFNNSHKQSDNMKKGIEKISLDFGEEKIDGYATNESKVEVMKLDRSCSKQSLEYCNKSLDNMGCDISPKNDPDGDDEHQQVSSSRNSPTRRNRQEQITISKTFVATMNNVSPTKKNRRIKLTHVTD